ncbi:camar1 transposase [Trichonephila clavipes]|nr:camar1 transposase [Trichonephila clavipes]
MAAVSITREVSIKQFQIYARGQGVYCQQLDRLKLAIDQKRPTEEVLCSLRTTPGLHTSVVTRQNLLELDWEVLMHPPYSPDLAPSDYHLFLALKTS